MSVVPHAYHDPDAGCRGCPFFDMHFEDTPGGSFLLTCGAMNRTTSNPDHWRSSAPEWCPLRKSDVVVRRPK